jgi:hypothetical protein
MKTRVKCAPARGAVTHGREALAIASLASRWHPFGGVPAEEIMVNFGLTPRRYRVRLKYLLDSCTSFELDLTPEMHSALRTRCRDQILAEEASMTRPRRAYSG